MLNFKEQVKQGIPNELPDFKALDTTVSHAPKRKDILSAEEKKLALKNCSVANESDAAVIFSKTIL